jgi:hypothetical protein
MALWESADSLPPPSNRAMAARSVPARSRRTIFFENNTNAVIIMMYL